MDVITVEFPQNEGIEVNMPNVEVNPEVAGVTVHNELSGRDTANQHPISAITGLQTALDGKQPTGNYLTSESDPTVPAWAKEATKPTYTAEEVHALPDTTVIPSLNGYATEEYVDNAIANSGIVTEHSQLTNRDAANQHPISAIIGLEKELDNLSIVANTTGENVVLTDSSDKPLEGLVLYGKTTQNGTPSPANPVPLVSAGDSGSIKLSVYEKNLLVTPESFDVNTNGNVVAITNGTVQLSTTGTYRPTRWRFPVPPYSRIFLHCASIDSGLNVEISNNLQGDNGDGNINVKMTVNAPSVYVDTKSYTELTLSVFSVTAAGTFAANQVMLEIGKKNAFIPPVPAQSLTVQTSDGLLGIPVTSGGNYTDANNQQWICDEIDFERGMYVQRCGTISSYDGESIDTPYISSTGELSTGAEVIYALAEPIPALLLPTEIAAYEALHTNQVNTFISNNGDAGMFVSYVADTKTYIDNKFSALEAAVLSLGGNV